MKPITVSGCIHGKTVVMDEDIGLPEGTPVTIHLRVASTHTPAEPASARMTLAERLCDVIGSASDLPSDMARNHDHYLHGTPKR